jgi:hypothetical protein
MPQNRPLKWELRREIFPTEVAQEMVKKTLDYGLPYTEQFNDWEALYAETVRLEGQYPIRGPIIKYLMGKPEEAVAILEAELARIQAQTDPGTEHYRKLANSLAEICRTRKTKSETATEPAIPPTTPPPTAPTSTTP